jgi:hypothetical protein
MHLYSWCFLFDASDKAIGLVHIWSYHLVLLKWRAKFNWNMWWRQRYMPPPHTHTNTPGPITFCQYSRSTLPVSFASMHRYYCNPTHQHSRSATTWERLIRNVSARRTKMRRSRVSHYRVIRDARLGASLINIHRRRATSKHITYLISGWAPMPLIRDSR